MRLKIRKYVKRMDMKGDAKIEESWVRRAWKKRQLMDQGVNIDYSELSVQEEAALRVIGEEVQRLKQKKMDEQQREMQARM